MDCFYILGSRYAILLAWLDQQDSRSLMFEVLFCIHLHYLLRAVS